MTPPPDAGDGGATDPAQALADVWDLLDVLPAATGSPDGMATTIEMAAVSAAGQAGATRNSGARRGTPSRDAVWPVVNRWLPGVAIVLCSLAVGIAAGRATAPHPDAAILGNLPVVQHLDLLREAGSVAFLEALAKAGYPPPRRPPVQSPEDVREDARAFDAAIRSLRASGDTARDREMLARRREQVLEMPDAERRQLERSAETFARLSGADRSELVAVGRALADPGREQLLEAARTWHLWVQLRNPADRRDLIDLPADDRLEWLDRATRLGPRIDAWRDGRDNRRPLFDREWENRRRPPPEFRRDDLPRPPGPSGPPRLRGRGGPPLNGPPLHGREPSLPSETEAPPR